MRGMRNASMHAGFGGDSEGTGSCEVTWKVMKVKLSPMLWRLVTLTIQVRVQVVLRVVSQTWTLTSDGSDDAVRFRSSTVVHAATPLKAGAPLAWPGRDTGDAPGLCRRPCRRAEATTNPSSNLVPAINPPYSKHHHNHYRSHRSTTPVATE